ncbi:hypothetical protein SASPL_123546 [Salvia splendens]|uniref:L-ascorbate oxidase n=1 Tax=Salvia splendens TaxID=180675 RepID=A0A8X8XNR8_SALSN|nr:hypothetical protein SASPL_123546 [Salvia splendens]
MKDQIGSFFYFPSLNFQRAAGGFGPIHINNQIVVDVPFPTPELDFDLLVGDWYSENFTVKSTSLKCPIPGKTYRFRISNVGNLWSVNFRIENHMLLLVETEGSYTNQTRLSSLDVHVGQSYSVLVTTGQHPADYYVVATPKIQANNSFAAVGVLHYDKSTALPTGPLPIGPDPNDINFSINQARSIMMNMTTGAARPNPQGSFNVTNVTLSQTFILNGHIAILDGFTRYTINNVSYISPSTPLKLADQFINGSGVYELDKYPIHSGLAAPVNGTFVVSGLYKGWLEIVFVNNGDMYDSCHLDGYGFFVVGFGVGQWTPEVRTTTYNLYNPIVRSTVQVYPGGWTAVYVYLDNPGMWNLRSQNLKRWYLGQELYIRVYDPDPNPAKERPPPSNLLFCGNQLF